MTQRYETEDARYQICYAGEGDLLLLICRSIDCQSYKIIPVNHSSIINHSDKFQCPPEAENELSAQDQAPEPPDIL